MLALSSPGVRVARAGDGSAASGAPPAQVSSGEAPGACKPGDAPKPRVDQAAISARIAERLRAEMESSGEKPIVLNGRGYNYRTSRDLQRELKILEADAARQQQASPTR
jgi:hypothetical protein